MRLVCAGRECSGQGSMGRQRQSFAERGEAGEAARILMFHVFGRLLGEL